MQYELVTVELGDGDMEVPFTPFLIHCVCLKYSIMKKWRKTPV